MSGFTKDPIKLVNYKEMIEELGGEISEHLGQLNDVLIVNNVASEKYHVQLNPTQSAKDCKPMPAVVNI